MGEIAMRMNTRYNLKDATEFEKAEKEICEIFNKQLEFCKTYSIPNIKKGSPGIRQPIPGTTELTFEIEENSFELLNSVASSYNSHPQHESGIWGEATVQGQLICIALPSTYVAQNKQRIIEMLVNSLNFVGHSWVHRQNQLSMQKKAKIEKELQLELNDLKVFK